MAIKQNDQEGAYRAEFIKKTLRLQKKNEQALEVFSTKENFLKLVRSFNLEHRKDDCCYKIKKPPTDPVEG